MRRSLSAFVPLSQVSTLIVSILIVSTLSFAAAPDRIAGAVVSQQLVRLPGSAPMMAKPEADRGPVDPSLKLAHLTLLTVPSASQQKAISRLLQQQQDRTSPQYHQWLTPEQYADRFGLSSNDIQKLTTWLQSQGFTIVEVARGRNFIVFSGSAAQAENAFQTKLHNFEVSGQTHFANVTPPSIPAALSGVVVGIRGLNNFRPKSQLVRSKPDYTLPVTGGNEFFLAPGDIATMYDLGPLYTAGTNGTGEKLAVIGETDVYLADLNDFRSGFDLPMISGCTFFGTTNVIQTCDSTNFQYVVVTGDTDPGSPNSLQDDLPEADLDLEWSNAVAQQAKIIYVNAPDPNGNGVYDSMIFTIDNNLAPVMTMSYSFICELNEAQFGTPIADEAEFAKANMEGITFLNSSGDFGAAECDVENQDNFPTLGYSVAYPASSPSVTGVGGTLIPYPDYTIPTFWSATSGTNGGSLVSNIPEEGWNDDQEFGEFCVANPTNSFCTSNGITDWATAQANLQPVLLASGGGVSNCITINNSNVCTGGFPQPAWQAGLSSSAVNPGGIGQTTTPTRFSPDVALLASVYWPGYIVCTPVNEVTSGTSTASICANGIKSALTTYGVTFGGTSVATPIFAGIVSLLNESFVGPGSTGLGNINPTLYALAATPANGVFHNAASTPPSLTIGNNGAFCAAGTPSTQPVALQCPSTGPNAGFLGFDASNFDPTTGYDLVTGLGSVDASKLVTAWGTARTASSVAVQASPTSIVYTQSVTLTATMSPSTATGRVTFFTTVNGTMTNLGPGTLSSGVATLSTTVLPIGSNSISASYAGDGYNATSSSTTPAVVDVVAPDFTLANTGSTTTTVLAGVPATGYKFTVTPVSGQTTFLETVSFACSGLPDATVGCVFNPASIAAGTPASAIPVTLTITTSGPNTSGSDEKRRQRAGNRSPSPSPWLPLTLPLAGVVMVGFFGRKVTKHAALAGSCLAMVMLGLLLACSNTTPVSVAVAPSAASLFPNDTADGWPAQSQAFTATVSNNSNTAVNWSISPSTAGSIDGNGNYTAPQIVAGLPAIVTVTATSQADSTKSATATVNLKSATVPGTYPVTVTVTESPTMHNVSPGYSLIVQ